MKLIKPTVGIITQGPGLDGLYKQIELAGRTCYKSEDKITEDSAKKFVDRMIESKHYAMLEHGTVYLMVPHRSNEFGDIRAKYVMNKYSKVIQARTDASQSEAMDYSVSAYTAPSDYAVFITTNLRVIVENGWEDDLKYICEPTEHHVKRYTAKFVTDRGVSHEFVRHRVFSFAQESQRYCNYSKEKHGNTITFIKPTWLMDFEKTCTDENIKNDKISYSLGHAEMNFKDALTVAEDTYFRLLQLGFTAQNARAVLPNCTKTELVMTGFESDWEHYFDLRSRGITGAPHPDAKYLADKLLNLMRNEGE